MTLAAVYRLMELRRREPDFRFRVVQMMRSVKRKRDRSFLPPTAFTSMTISCLRNRRRGAWRSSMPSM